MFVPQTMLVLTPQVVDEKIISPLRDSSKYKLNEWRNLVAQAIGFSSYHDLLKRDQILFDRKKISSLLNYSAEKRLHVTMASLCTWYVPSTLEGYLCACYDSKLNSFDSFLYDDDGRGLWSSGCKYYRIGNICMSMQEAERFLTDLNEQIIETEFKPSDLESSDLEYAVMSTLKNYEYVQRSSPYEFWEHYGTYEERQSLLNCKSIKQFYSKVADFVGKDGEGNFASLGFTIAEFIEELLDDETLHSHLKL